MNKLWEAGLEITLSLRTRDTARLTKEYRPTQSSRNTVKNKLNLLIVLGLGLVCTKILVSYGAANLANNLAEMLYRFSSVSVKSQTNSHIISEYMFDIY